MVELELPIAISVSVDDPFEPLKEKPSCSRMPAQDVAHLPMNPASADPADRGGFNGHAEQENV
jgi:hypothetical protein